MSFLIPFALGFLVCMYLFDVKGLKTKLMGKKKEDKKDIKDDKTK